MPSWIYPVENSITGATKINQADNKIQASMDDLEDWINGTGVYAGGLGAIYGSIADATDTSIATPTNEDGLRYNSTSGFYENVPVYSKAQTDTLLTNYQAIGTYNTIIGTDTDISTPSATVLSSIAMTDGVITSHATRTLTTADIGAATAGHNHDVTYQPLGTYNTIIGTDADLNTSGANIIGDIQVTDGVITSMSTRPFLATDISALTDDGHTYLTNGFQKLSNGLILQWGSTTAVNASLTFPVAFPTAALNVTVSIKTTGYATTSNVYSYFYNLTSTGFSFVNFSPSTFTWFAVGH